MRGIHCGEREGREGGVHCREREGREGEGRGGCGHQVRGVHCGEREGREGGVHCREREGSVSRLMNAGRIRVH